MTDEKTMKEVEKEHVLARRALKKRYGWELQAIAQDIINKMEMEVLTVESIASYLSNLLNSHPRTRNEERAAETIMVSSSRQAVARELEVVRILEHPSNDDPLTHEAYYAMGQDVLTLLQDHNINVKPEE